MKQAAEESLRRHVARRLLDEAGDRLPARRCDGAQFVPENLFQRHAGAMAGYLQRALDRVDAPFVASSLHSCCRACRRVINVGIRLDRADSRPAYVSSSRPARLRLPFRCDQAKAAIDGCGGRRFAPVLRRRASKVDDFAMASAQVFSCGKASIDTTLACPDSLHFWELRVPRFAVIRRPARFRSAFDGPAASSQVSFFGDAAAGSAFFEYPASRPRSPDPPPR